MFRDLPFFAGIPWIDHTTILTTPEIEVIRQGLKTTWIYLEISMILMFLQDGALGNCFQTPYFHYC